MLEYQFEFLVRYGGKSVFLLKTVMFHRCVNILQSGATYLKKQNKRNVNDINI